MTEKRLKWYGHAMRMKEEHLVRRMLDVDIQGREEEDGQIEGGKMRVREI